MASKRHMTIPKSTHKGFEKLLSIDDDAYEQLLSALNDASPKLYRTDFVSSLLNKLSVDSNDLRELIYVLTGMYVAREANHLSIPDFVDVVCQALQETKNDDLKPRDDDWDAFKQKLSHLLEFEQSVGATAKAMDVMTDHEHVYITNASRILSDIRPIYTTEDVSGKPAAAVVTHTLKIGYQEGGEVKEFFVALDSNDLKQLRVLLDRAEQKDQSLHAVLAIAEIPCLEAGED